MRISFLFYLILAFITVTSCTKERNKSSLTVMLTDAPAKYDQVNIDVQGVEITGSGGEKVLLHVNSGIYNLLEFSNGAKTMLATGDLEPGTIEQIRLILGSNNSVMVDSVVHPLSTPSAQQSGLKLQVHKTFEPGVDYSLTLDFDALQSVVVKGNGQFQLKPVIRVLEEAISGSIRGSILPDSVATTVTAVRDTLSYSTVANDQGKFLLSGLPAGTYNITITPDSMFLPVIIPNKQVSLGVSTDLGIIQLQSK